jgi:hypothetical protein
MAKFKVAHGDVKHGRQRLATGAVIEMDEKPAARLVRAGILSAVAPSTPPIPVAPKAPEKK